MAAQSAIAIDQDNLHAAVGAGVRKGPAPYYRNDPALRQKLAQARIGLHGAIHDPGYLNACGLHWQQEKDAPSGWELVEALRSNDPRARSLAASFLAKTQDSRIPIREVRRAGRRQSLGVQEERGRNIPEIRDASHGLSMIDDCTQCKVRRRQWFCGLSNDGLKQLSAASRPSAFPNGALLFMEGQQARGAYVLCHGQAKLSTTSREGRILILRMAGSGEVLGLSAALSAGSYELTAEASGPCYINFVERNALLTAMEKCPEIGLRSALAVSWQLQRSYRDVHDLVLSRSSAGKLARLILSWAHEQSGKANRPEGRVPATLTHEEMAQMIGTSRETVTRLLGDLKKKDLIEVDGSTLVIRNREALEALAA